jgi:hypothetical protein
MGYINNVKRIGKEKTKEGKKIIIKRKKKKKKKESPSKGSYAEILIFQR